MALDIASEVKLALQAPDMAEWMRQEIIKRGVLDALAAGFAELVEQGRCLDATA